MFIQLLPSPNEMKEQLPLSPYAKERVQRGRDQAEAIVLGRDSKTALIVGPCSIHEIDSTLEYAVKLKKLAEDVQENFSIFMRVFIEKPRTKIGWKGLIHDPGLDGSNDMEKGIALSRELLLRLAHLGMPCATEFVDPLFIPYLEDLISWGFIGARTSASQPHRELASGLAFPIGFKNQVDGDIEIAIDGALSARCSHSSIGIDASGRVAKLSAQGNPLSHLVLRGSDAAPNFDPLSIASALYKMRNLKLDSRILVDCSHGNSQRKAEQQRVSFHSILNQIVGGSSAIMGLMLESFLYEGKQSLKEYLQYGVSITDACLGWKETEELISSASDLLSSSKKELPSLSISMSSVQN